MRWIVRILIGLVVVIAVTRLLIGHYFPTWPFRYKVTVEVQTPEGPKSGSSVMQADYKLAFVGHYLGQQLFSSTFDGEAVFVDLGQGKNLVLTLRNEGSKSKNSQSAILLPVYVFDLPWFRGTRDTTLAGMPEAIEQARNAGPVDVPFDMLPLLATIENPLDKASASRLDPESLSVTFGEGYRLSKVTLEASSEPLSRDLNLKLPFLNDVHAEVIILMQDSAYQSTFELTRSYYIWRTK